MSIPSKKSSISALSNSSGYLFVSRPGIYTFTSGSVKTEGDKFFAVFCGFVCQKVPGAPGAKTPGCWDPGQLGLVLLREFGSLQGVWEFGFVSCAPGAGRPDTGKLSTGY